MTLILALVLAPLVVLTSCFAVELLVGLRPLRGDDLASHGPIKAIILVPAHNEAAIIGKRLAALNQAAAGIANILVVADNCVDHTAKLARELGAAVIERSDVKRRGKGFALDAARAHLRTDPPDVVIIVDADCWTDAASLRRLIHVCAITARPCQAMDLQSPCTAASPGVQLSTFAFYVKNLIRQRALQRIAGRTHLLGTGMAFPWFIFERAELATDNIVEDLALGIKLAVTGHPPMLVEAAEVWSAAETEKNTIAQRSRWEGGYLRTAGQVAPRLFRQSLKTADIGGIWAAIDLLIPPFALLVLLDFGALSIAAALIETTPTSGWPAAVLAASLACAAVAVSLVWIFGGRKFVTLASLARIPAYLLWKLPLYLHFARRGAPKEWIRTREG